MEPITLNYLLKSCSLDKTLVVLDVAAGTIKLVSGLVLSDTVSFLKVLGHLFYVFMTVLAPTLKAPRERKCL